MNSQIYKLKIYLFYCNRSQYEYKYKNIQNGEAGEKEPAKCHPQIRKGGNISNRTLRNWICFSFLLFCRLMQPRPGNARFGKIWIWSIGIWKRFDSIRCEATIGSTRWSPTSYSSRSSAAWTRSRAATPAPSSARGGSASSASHAPPSPRRAFLQRHHRSHRWAPLCFNPRSPRKL